jgi:hypothetical protein
VLVLIGVATAFLPRHLPPAHDQAQCGEQAGGSQPPGRGPAAVWLPVLLASSPSPSPPPMPPPSPPPPSPAAAVAVAAASLAMRCSALR